ncbi:MAG: TDP-N-acetylfucosamine:lipid II N-acetylfucosaminyltransferase, partial [Ginsengibacter sp.]
PLAYGDENYGRLIEREARKRFPAVEVQKEKLDSLSYYKKLTEVACCIINVRVQQGLGNIIALVWMGAKVFLDEESSTYKDFHNWGIHVFSIQKDLNLRELSTKLSESEIENNKSIMFKICNENTVKQYWDKILAS